MSVYSSQELFFSTTYKLVSAASTNATSISTSPNTGLVAYYLSNSNGTSFRYVKFYNKASAPTVGTDTPVMTIAIPPLGAANAYFPPGVFNFTTGLAFAITGAAADSDTTIVSANEVIVNLSYWKY